MEPRKREPWLIMEDLLKVIRLYEAGADQKIIDMINQETVTNLKVEVHDYLQEIYTTP